MLVVISPAKTLDFDTPHSVSKITRPRMLNASAELVEELRQYSSADLQNLMKISDKLADLNAKRYQDWQLPFKKTNAKAAIFAFQGDVYVGLQAQQFGESDLLFAQEHLRILSGLYGLLRPLDLIQAYRLEMGTSLRTKRGSTLYQFWGEELTKAVNKDLKALKTKTLVNLASNEYFDAINPDLLHADIVTPVFKDFKNGKYKFLSFFAKKARGMMSAYIVKNRIVDIEQIKRANIDGYRYSREESDEHKWVFLRKAP